MSKSELISGKVIKATRNSYLVRYDDQIASCTVRGKLAGAPDDRKQAVKVGDDVKISLVKNGEGIIEEILERRSKLSRAVEGKAYKEHIIATNIDQILIIMSTRKPVFKSGLLDRYLTIAEKNHLHAIICINKIELAKTGEFARYQEYYTKLGYPVYLTSAKKGTGIDKLADVLTDKVSALVGQSGVGKSSLIKTIDPSLDLKIGETSSRTLKGVHTTTHVQLFPLKIDGYVIDTPGIRELGLWDIFQNDLKHYFVDFHDYEPDCQFNDCNHLKEPGCAVKKAVKDGKILGERHENYKNIHEGLRSASYELIKSR